MSTELLDAPDLSPEEKHARWLAVRRTGIGGSDAAAACGLSPYKTPYALYMEKRGEIAEPDLSNNDAVQFGIKLESVVADEYELRTGKRVRQVNRTLRHTLFPYMLGNVDRKIVGENAGLECKTAGYWPGQDEAWGASGSDEVPPAYLLQCQHYMAVTGWDRFDLAVLIAGQDFRLYTIPRDEQLIQMLINVEGDFWRRVNSGVPPTPTSLDDVRRRFPKSFSTPIVTTAAIYGHVLDLKAAKESVKELEAEIDAHKAAIADYMADCDTLVDDAGVEIVTWKEKSLGERIDSKRVKAELPDVYAKLREAGYITSGSTREMRLKGGA